MTIASYALSGISALCLVTSLFLFIFSGEKGFFKTEINILYFNLCIALLISNLLFILYGLKPDVLGIGDFICKILAGAIHYSWILVFAWCFGFAIYIAIKINFGEFLNTTEIHYFCNFINNFLNSFILLGINSSRKIYPYIILFAWTTPIIFPILTIALKFGKYVDMSKHCFPSKQEYILLSLLVPILALSLFTLVTLVVMCLRFVGIRKRIDDDVIRADIKHIMLSTAVFTSILTIPWITLVVYFLIDNSIVEWVFVLLNDTIGIFFFIFISLRVREVTYLILCKSKQNTTESPQVDARLNAVHNPIYDEDIQTINPDENYLQMIKLGADFLPYGEFCCILNSCNDESINQHCFDHSLF